MKGSTLRADPSVAAVVPCCNDGRFLRRAVSSLRQQSVPFQEIVLVDDGSTDTETIELMDELSREEGIRLIRFAENRGPSAARNAGISSVEVDYILLLDADDSSEPSFTEKALQRYTEDRHQEIAVVGCYLQRYSMDDRGIAQASGQWKPSGGGIAAFLLANECNSCLLMRRIACKEVKGYDEQMRLAEDWELWIRLTAAGWRIDILPFFLHNYYVHGSNRSRDPSPETRARIHVMQEHIYQKHEYLYRKHFFSAFFHLLHRLSYNPKRLFDPPPMLGIATARASASVRLVACVWLLMGRVWSRIDSTIKQMGW